MHDKPFTPSPASGLNGTRPQGREPGSESEEDYRRELSEIRQEVNEGFQKIEARIDSIQSGIETIIRTMKSSEEQ